MAITSGTLSRSAAVAAGWPASSSIGVQIGHPHLDVTSVGTTEWAVRNTAKTVFADAGARRNQRHVPATGQADGSCSGLVAYLLLSHWLPPHRQHCFVAGDVLPSLAQTDPAFVNGVLAVAAGGDKSRPTSD